MKKIFSGKTQFSFYWILVIMIAFSSCNSFDGEKIKPSTNLQIGDEIELASKSIPISGGTVTVTTPENVIDGLEVIVPANSYPGSKTFTISTAEIKNHKLGQYFNPLTPLIQIGNGGGYASTIMEITIPITVPEGHIPLGFYYDEITGKLEAIPIESYTNKSITLLTSHFMSASELSPSNNLKAAGIKIDASSNIVISSIAESVLKAKPIISSGFKVGIDDWEFTNYGSYLVTGGHCTGQNIGAMWYYFEKKLKGESGLFNKFSTVQSLWQDNAIGYRFCSVIHKDLVWKGTFIDLFDKYIDKKQSMDKFKLYAIAGAMLTTGEPQGIGIYRQIGTYTDGTPQYEGHDLICHQVSINDGKLYISDPNEPGNEQFITFKNDKFEPYLAKLNGNAISNPYPFVTWYAKTAYIDWPQIGKRYEELLDSTIGNVAPNIFPPYTIWVKGKVDQELKDGFSMDSDTFRCIVECPTAEQFSLRNEKKLITFDMYDKDGNQIDNWEKNKFGAYVILKPGINKIGFCINSTRNGVVDKDNEQINLFIDFKWFNVYYSKLSIEPNPIVGEPKEEIKITALSKGSAPKKAKYVWNFGDGTKEVSIKNDSIVKHTFPSAGDFDVTLDLYDSSNDKLIGHATTKAKIGKAEFSLIISDAKTGVIIDRQVEFCKTYLLFQFKVPAGTPSNYTVRYNMDEEGSEGVMSGPNFGINVLLSKTGKHIITGQILDQNNKVVNELKYELEVTENDFLEQLKKYTRIQSMFSCDMGHCHYMESGEAFNDTYMFEASTNANDKITWSGRTFKYELSNATSELKIEGTFSSSCWMLESFISSYKSAGYKEWKVEATNVPILGAPCPDYKPDRISFILTGENQLKTQLKASGWRYDSFDKKMNIYKNSDLKQSDFRLIFISTD